MRRIVRIVPVYCFHEETRAVPQDNMFDNSKAKACAFFLRGEVARDAVKPLANPRQMGFRKARAFI